MGANLTSPLPHHHRTQTTSVCNHLFSPGDGGPTFAPQRDSNTSSRSSSNAKESVLMQGWNWSKRNIQPVMSRRSLPKSGSSSEATSSKSSDSLVSFTRNVSTSTSSQYGKISISLDRNQNYKSVPRPSDTTTIIPNYYSLREEFRRGLQINTRQDLVNNNLASNDLSVIGSPKHVPRPRSVLRDDNANCDISPIAEQENVPSEASTSELLRGLGIFISNNCDVSDFDPAHLVTWLRSVDRSLLLQGWQDIAFINPANLVFIFLLVRDVLPDERHLIHTLEELHAWILSCLYVSYSYMGNEISYPLKPFLIGNDRNTFWNRCVAMVTSHSRQMLLLNSSSTFFSEVFTDLKHCSSSE
ncbi:Cyclin-dependent kinase 5 activator 1 [Caenorhabditis elegans]|uniref:Cyclin-dependent kinase 5 activator 1 n=1 Tax=Caenorhabditis elegans TaxID=6239 RepID=CD5R1_CAEEL|nr:Cyclin-dependent kinase 5 activator 1 [Caenorhabditis elegans]Q22695.2 RecName: Full=Cyclin-dependent kinase 5 activator 1; AltName: Full=p35 [Caenorhabditis elegans]CAA86458.2 Cyclin-dependent kinase 5 activator 1 [Caenorhabditis elegans]|eukprot:NP_001076649.1 Cyclin-dependent kinase 5 activator 1 [Caenorhabditis elegans]